MSLRTPIEEGFGRFMAAFYAQLVADTPAMTEYVARGLSKSIVWAPGRMIDQVEDMLAEWRKNDNKGAPGTSSYLPVIICAMSKDFEPSPPDWGIAVGTEIDVVSPADTEERMYKARLSLGDYRTQLAIIAPEAHTAHSLALQFNLFTNGPNRRRFKTIHMFAGLPHEFNASLEAIDIGSMGAQLQQDNLTALVADINVRAVIPLFQAPKGNEANDGKSAPAGYPTVQEVTAVNTVTGTESRAYIDGDGTAQGGLLP
jgi:hypothetical protein